MTARKEVEIARKRVPLRKLFHGKEIREAMAEMEKFRQQFNEQEFFYGAKVTLLMVEGDVIASVRRLETDKEYEKRLEKIKQEELAKLERQRAKDLREQERARQKEAYEQAIKEQQRLADLATLKALTRKLGLSAKELANINI